MRLKKKTHPVVRFAAGTVIILVLFSAVPAVAAVLVAANAALWLYVARRAATPEPAEL